VRRMQAIDRWYGAVAGLVIASGLGRLFLGVKGPAFYVHNPVFWTKMALFLAIALISIVPTLAYLRWNARREPDGAIILAGPEFARLRTLVWIQLALFVLIPLCATLMARGL